MINNKYPSIWHRVFNIHYVTNILIWQITLDTTRKANFAFNFLMKRVIWGQLSKIILFFFNFSLGRDAFKSIFSKLLSILTEDSPSDQIKDDSHNCMICKNIFTMKTTLERCQHSFCYYCITKHMNNVSGLCPICFSKWFEN